MHAEERSAFLMGWLGELGRRVVMLGRKRKFGRDLEDEMRLHIDLREEEQVSTGLSPQEARYATRRRFGNTTLFREESDDMWGWGWFEHLIQDLRYGLRQLRRSPGFTAVAVLTLALGIGANTAIFSVMSAVVLRFLPVSNPQRLVYLHNSNRPQNTFQTGNDEFSFTDYTFEQLRREHGALSDLMAFVPLGIGKVAVRYGEEPEEAMADMVSGNFFSGLHVELAHGRGFTLEDEARHSPVAVLSYDYWTRRFARNPSVLGQTLYVKGVPFTVIGVGPRGFFG